MSKVHIWKMGGNLFNYELFLTFELKKKLGKKYCLEGDFFPHFRHCSDAAPRCRSFQYDSVGTVCDLFEHTLASESAYAAQSYEPLDG